MAGENTGCQPLTRKSGWEFKIGVFDLVVELCSDYRFSDSDERGGFFLFGFFWWALVAWDLSSIAV